MHVLAALRDRSAVLLHMLESALLLLGHHLEIYLGGRSGRSSGGADLLDASRRRHLRAAAKRALPRASGEGRVGVEGSSLVAMLSQAEELALTGIGFVHVQTTMVRLHAARSLALLLA